MTFLLHLFHNEDQQYGVIAVVRSALSAISPESEGKNLKKGPMY